MKFNRTNAFQGMAVGATLTILATASHVTTSQAAPNEKKTMKSSTQAAISIRDVQTVWHRRAWGNGVFTSRLRAELASQGLRFVPNAAGADAVLDSEGQYTARGFSGKMVFRDRAGRVIWSENVFRPENSQVMAYQKLAQALRARRR